MRIQEWRVRPEATTCSLIFHKGIYSVVLVYFMNRILLSNVRKIRNILLKIVKMTVHS